MIAQRQYPLYIYYTHFFIDKEFGVKILTRETKMSLSLFCHLILAKSHLCDVYLWQSV